MTRTASFWEETGIYPFEAWFYVGGRDFLMEQYQAGGAMDLGLWFDEVMKLQPETAYLNHRKLLYSFGYELDGSVSPSSGMQTESTTYLFAENRYLFNREQEVARQTWRRADGSVEGGRCCLL